MNREVAKLVITTSNFTTTIQKYGYRTTNWDVVYVTNLNLSQILGETIYSNYDKFQVNIMPFGNQQVGELTTVYLEGMNLINSTYQGQPVGNSVPILGLANSYSINMNSVNDLPSIRNFTMIKPIDTNLNLTFRVAYNDGTPAALSAWTYMLTFTPIKDVIYKNPYNSLHTLEQANFMLSTQLLTAGSTTQFGTMNAGQNNFTFFNINMRQILGSLWDKYEKFNLITNCQVGIPTASTSGNARRTFYQISGLQFINSTTLSNPTQNPSLSVAYTPIFVNSGQNVMNGDVSDSPCNIVTFRKPESENVNLNFQIGNCSTGGLVTTTFGRTIITFSIVGVNPTL
jgi:hypothetical protein